jgi:sortase A
MKRTLVALSLAFAGLLLFGQGAYIHAKAIVAQVLLERAFSQTVATGNPIKPWSWADTWPVARIVVKRIDANAIVGRQQRTGSCLRSRPCGEHARRR